MGSATINLGMQWQNRRGVIVESTDSMIIDGSVTLIPVTAVTAGSDSNCAENDTFELISPVANVENKATLSTNGLTGGADIESIDSLRARLLFRVQYPPAGGNRFDYIRWALECAGVTRAWCIPAPMYANYVTVFFVLDNQVDIIPTELDLTRVGEYIEGHVNEVTNQWEGKPPATELIMLAPSLRYINPTIKIYPDKPELRTAVEAALNDLLYGVDIGETVYLSQLRAAVSNVTGIIDCHITNLIDDVTAQYNELITLGTITWQ